MQQQKKVGRLNLILCLLLSEAQSSGFAWVCEPAEMSARWHSELQIKIIRSLYFHHFFASLIFGIVDKPDRYLYTILKFIKI